MPGGASASATVTVVPQVARTIDSTARASGYVGDVGSTGGGGDQITQIAPAPRDVQVTGFASTGPPAVGSTFTYAFLVKDNGHWSVGDVTFSDHIPSPVTFVGASACDLGGLNVGQQVDVVIAVVAPSTPSTFTNTATVTASATDTQASNNFVSVTVQVK